MYGSERIDLRDVEHFDVAIVGAGPAGCATALALLAHGDCRVALIHHPPPEPLRQIGESAAPSVNYLLRRLGLSASLASMGHIPCWGHISLWGGDHELWEQGHILHGEGHGWHLHRASFDDWLRRCASERGAALWAPARFERVGRLERGRWGLCVRQWNERRVLTASVLVDASGRAARLARRLGARRRRIDNLVAISGLGMLRKERMPASLVESHARGWFYAAAIPEGGALMAFFSDVDLIGDLRDTRKFARMLAASRLVSRHVVASEHGVYRIYPAYSAYLDHVAGRGWLAVGDAALAMDPLTASGIHCALADGLAAAPAIFEYLEHMRMAKLVAYAERMNRCVRYYLRERRMRYAMERRWAEQCFWSRRNEWSASRA